MHQFEHLQLVANVKKGGWLVERQDRRLSMPNCWRPTASGRKDGWQSKQCLAIQDRTFLDYSHRPSKAEMGLQALRRRGKKCSSPH